MNRAKMAYIFMAFLLVWYAGTVAAVQFLGLPAMEGVGLGTAGGVFIKSFSDMWQFLWRTSSPAEKAAGQTAPDLQQKLDALEAKIVELAGIRTGGT